MSTFFNPEPCLKCWGSGWVVKKWLRTNDPPFTIQVRCSCMGRDDMPMLDRVNLAMMGKA